jgi:branched-chain amino acid transport system ATP-binding protein
VILQVRDLHAGYAGSEVLHGIDLAVEEGQGVVVLGPNGHGKTTLLRTISGLLRPTAGTLAFDGQDITGWRADQIAAAGLIHIPQGDLLFGEMSVVENLLMGAYHKETWPEREERLDQVFDVFPWLRDRRRQVASSLSGGERRMLALGRGLMSRARLLLIDEPSLHSVLNNLIGNAIKFTERGFISLVVRTAALGDAPAQLVIAVQDSGIGIPDDKQTKVFESFSQADSSTTRRYGGTGLGLAICKELAEMMGGAISVESRVGIGSTFTVASRPSAVASMSPGSGTSATVVFVNPCTAVMRPPNISATRTPREFAAG